ncbi:MAG TPA: ABC transporter permease [Longilinea sp.]|nr:ABC transporter permease [Longilinea sp.]
MHTFLKLAWMQTKLYLREPMAVFFTLAFGPLMLVMMGFIFGGQARAELGGISQLDYSVPAYIALVVGMTGLTSLPITVTQRRDMGVLRRYSATPLKPIIYFMADVVAPVIVTLMGIAILVLMGLFIYKVQFPGNVWDLVGAVCLTILSFYALGFALASLYPNTRVAMVVGNVLVIPVVIFSGAMVPSEVMPAAMNTIAQFDPLTHAVTLIKGLWFAGAWGDHLLEVGVLGGIFVVCTLIVAFTFKWE